MRFLHLGYDMPLYRPPSEANSLILQLTIGCSWNKCAFCEMYKAKKFRIRTEEEIEEEIEFLATYDTDVRRVFFADGNAMVLSADKLLRIIDKIHANFPKVHRISAYALPKDILSKSEEDLKALKEAGLNLLYVGIESGDDELLEKVNKGETYESTLISLLKAKQAGIKLSLMVINGLGGKKYSFQHALNSAKLINEIQPEYVSTLVLSFPTGEKKYAEHFNGDYESMTKIDLIQEMEVFLEHSDLNCSIFRSDHASNYLVLKGILGRDKGRLLMQVKKAISNPHLVELKEEWQLGF
ncbi:MAG: B12-binding domain-containing radical SAM protein [Bacteroidetes bacterium]|nr:B12-binding domain-containing radical SAM protein [Bacteroidota bacterium]MBT5992717.1 B12-binding domain-containing radical SAM protein [Bacteroidota bacterium]MBT7039799.1 B12-binding domain-containing radical SAM protein [Bacteroidota bacterium]MBT7996351.1 B12-binding domain-containing radical SAM protein [Bacteroidota bacterium]